VLLHLFIDFTSFSAHDHTNEKNINGTTCDHYPKCFVNLMNTIM